MGGFDDSLYHRLLLEPVHCDQWPKQRPCYKCELRFERGSSGAAPHYAESNLKALTEAKQRPDIDFLALHLDMLFHEEFRRHVAELLETDDRLWTVELTTNEECDIPIKGRFMKAPGLQKKELLQECLFVFRNVKILSLSHRGDYESSTETSKGLSLWRCMPAFQQLETMNFRGMSVHQALLEELMDLPFAPKITGIRFDDSLDLEGQLDFSKGKPRP